MTLKDWQEKERKILEAKRYYTTNKAVYETILAAMENMLNEWDYDQDKKVIECKIASSKDWIEHYTEMLQGY